MVKAQEKSSLWIYGPALDLIVGCGAWSAPLLLISYASISSSTRVWAIAFYVLALILSHSWPRILPWIFTIYLTWSPWHYSGQNYGLFMMFARRAGAQPTKETRWALYGAFIVS